MANIREVEYEKRGLSRYLPTMWPDGDGETCAFVHGNVDSNLTHFINHSCSPNCVVDEQEFGSLFIFTVTTSSHIAIVEEIMYDYRMRSNSGDRVMCNYQGAGCQMYVD